MKDAKEASPLSTETVEPALVAGPRERPKRPARKALHDPGRLKFPNLDPNFHYYMIATDKEHNDNKLQSFIENYWEPVLRKELYGLDCDNSHEHIGVNDNAKLRLMKLPIELHREDEAVRQAERDEVVHQAKEKAGEFGGMTTTFGKDHH